MNVLRHFLFVFKMPQLPPESTSMMALNLLQQLSSLAHLATASYDTPSSAADVNRMQQLWGIALRALNTDFIMGHLKDKKNSFNIVWII
nr:ubiquitin carboxyl-terminal hydrolase 34-like isoform X2 [Parasteatoda tepidariorum]